MEKAVYFILILCGILSQGSCHVTEENNAAEEKSSDLLIRQKRIVGGSLRRLTSSPFLLHILQNGNVHCPATLIADDVAITSAACFVNQNTLSMRVQSRSPESILLHRITRVILLDPHYNPAHPTVNNLALVRFAPPIIQHASHNRVIRIYTRNLSLDHATPRVISWATSIQYGTRLIPSNHFETFSVILINFGYCQQVYPNIIGDRNICAIGTNAGEYCDTNQDSGIPLIKNNQLLGIFVYRCNSCLITPNVFMSLYNEDIRRWIHQHVPQLRLF